MSSSFLLSEYKFTVKEINKDGKVFTKVSRIDAKCDLLDLELCLDINSEIYSMEKNKDYLILLTKSINDGPEEKGVFDVDDFKKPSLMDNYDYVMYGKVYRISDPKDGKMTVFASFGGLLMSLKGSSGHLEKFSNDTRLYIMIRAA